jgi:hypothetical protein
MLSILHTKKKALVATNRQIAHPTCRNLRRSEMIPGDEVLQGTGKYLLIG